MVIDVLRQNTIHNSFCFSTAEIPNGMGNLRLRRKKNLQIYFTIQWNQSVQCKKGIHAERTHTYNFLHSVIIGAYQTFSPNQKNKVESWLLFILNRAGQARVIDAPQTTHVSGEEAWEQRDSFQMRDACFYHRLLSANCHIFDGGGCVLQYLEQVNKLLHLTWDLSWDRCVQMCCVQGR